MMIDCFDPPLPSAYKPAAGITWEFCASLLFPVIRLGKSQKAEMTRFTRECMRKRLRAPNRICNRVSEGQLPSTLFPMVLPYVTPSAASCPTPTGIAKH
jgi:hypothetical protein